MRATPILRRQQGFSLIELLVAVAIGLSVLVGLAAVYVAAKQSYRFQETSGRIQEDANYALETISRDVRMAGFAGCKTIDSTNPVSVLSNNLLGPVFETNSGAGTADARYGPNPLAGVVPALAALAPLKPGNTLMGFDAVPAAMLPASVTAPTGTGSSLFFSQAGANGLTTTMATSSGALSIAADTFKWGDATRNSGLYTMVMSDCTNSSLFAGKVSVTGGVVQLDHTVAMGNSTADFLSGYTYGCINNTNPAIPTRLCDGGGGSVFLYDTIVMPLQWTYFYVGTRTGASTPSWYKVFFDGNVRQDAQELVSNVEFLRLYYGENLNGKDATGTACLVSVAGCTPNRTVDVWRKVATTAGAEVGVSDWANVVAIRVGLMMLSDEQNTTADVTANTPTLLGDAYTLPAGASTTRLRKEFSTTIALRNRMPLPTN
jgi:type IV pilus assembly protein PilW